MRRSKSRYDNDIAQLGKGPATANDDGLGSKNIAKACIPSFLRMFLFTSRGELILVCGLGREELFEVRAATAVMM